MDRPFVMKGIRDTPFSSEKYEAVPDAVTISTTEDFEVKGERYHEFYATWKVVTEKLKGTQLRADLKEGKTVGPIKLVQKESKKKPGSKYYDLVPA